MNTISHKGMEDYLAECREVGVKLEKPAPGKLLVRVPPEVHGKALVAAQTSGKSLNQWATEVLQSAVQAGLHCSERTCPLSNVRTTRAVILGRPDAEG